MVFILLGSWQLIRLNWKLELISEIENSISSEPVSFSGENLKNFKKVNFKANLKNSRVIYLYSLNESGKPGFDIINTIIIGNKNFLLNRGWIPKNFKNKNFDISTPNLTGILRKKSNKNYFKPRK